MSRQPLVSVCMPVRNGAAHVAAALESVLSQDLQDLELVVSDNSSTDGTVDIVRAVAASDPRVRLLQNERDIGGIANWNKVAAAAVGRYVKLLAADDLLYPGALSAQVRVLEDPENEGVAFVSSQRDIVDEAGRLLLRGRGLGRLSGRVDAAAATRATVRSGTNLFGEPHVVLFRRALLPTEGAFKHDRSYMVDLDLWLRLLDSGDAHALRQTVGAFRVHARAESVRVAGEQALHAGALFRDLERSGRVTAADRRIGVARASAQAVARRGLYGWLRLRRAKAA